MRIALQLLVLYLAWHQASCKNVESSTERLEAASKTDKRALTEGNTGLNKRSPLLAVNPGIVYAESKQSLSDKSPSQQVYATSAPHLAKISDVLTDQASSFPTAIANHLYSPVPVYQSFVKEPTTYQVSAPVPSHLAYSEHKILYPATAPQTNSIKYYNQPQKIFTQAPQIYHQPFTFARTTALSYAPQQIQQSQLYPAQNQIYQQQQIQIPQHLIYESQQNIQPGVIYAQNDQSNPSNTRPQTFTQSVPGITYAQPQQVVAQRPVYTQPQTTIQAGVTYTQDLSPAPVQYATSQASYTAPGVITKQAQRDLNSQPINVVDQGSDVDNQPITNEVKSKGAGAKGAVSYASFSQSTASNSGLVPQATNQYLPTAAKPPTSLPKAPLSNINYISAISKPVGGYVSDAQPIGNSVVGYYPPPNFYHSVPQQAFVHGPYQAPPMYQPQVGYVQQNFAASPSFPAVQYFGKFAQSLFGGYAQ